MKKYKEVQETVEKIESITCDVCGKDIFDDILEYEEKVSINYIGGYGSVFGDGSTVEIDICQKCFKDKLGEYIHVS